MEQDMIFEPSADLAKSALVDADGYAALYQESIANPDQFWAEHGERIDWIKPCLLYTSPSPRDAHESRMPSSA